METESTALRQMVVEFPINLVGPFRDASTMQSVRPTVQSNAAVERLSARASGDAQIAFTVRLRSSSGRYAGNTRPAPLSYQAPRQYSYEALVHSCVERVRIPFCPSCPFRHIGEMQSSHGRLEQLTHL